MKEFPKDFLWGAATSAHQVEGDNTNNDWWEWEQCAGLAQTSGRACRHYELFSQDFDLAQSLNHNCHRFSIEWSRIEPQEGSFSEKEISHYAQVIRALRERHLTPVVTLHHFTNPIWFSAIGGWENKKAGFYFLRFVERVVSAFAEDVRWWVTLNEPMIYVYHGYITGLWPPRKKSLPLSRKVERNFVSSHCAAYRLIHRIYKEKGLSSPRVSIAHNMQAFVACSPTWKNTLGVYLRDTLFNFEFIDRIRRQGAVDFIGLNYYTRGLVDVRGWGLKNLLTDFCRQNHHPVQKNDMGWDIYPQGLYELLLKLDRRFSLPIFILENGTCVQEDSLRWQYILEHLQSVQRAIEGGVRVLGYIYWSLIDNYEWDKGFWPRFGLIDIDYSTFNRTPRESARRFSEVCRTNQLI